MDIPEPSDPAAVRRIVSRAIGVVRHGEELRDAVAALLPMVSTAGPASDPAAVALMINVAALERKESRGAHFRSDFPCKAEEARRSRLTLDQAIETASELLAQPTMPFARSA
jgi:L-aspartate oxidase